MNGHEAKSLTFAELSEQRRKTDIVSRYLREQLANHLETLRPVLAPERLLGRLVGGKADVPGADRALAELQTKFRAFASPPYELPPELDQHWLTLIGDRLELHPWDYAYEARSETVSKTISITAPTRWIVNYSAGVSIAQIKHALTGREQRWPDLLRQFVINALVLQQLVIKAPGLGSLLADLRFDLKTEQPPGLARLPLVVISSCVSSFRPADDLVLNATALSGVPAFIELIDLEAVKSWQDPLRQRIEQLLSSN